MITLFQNEIMPKNQWINGKDYKKMGRTFNDNGYWEISWNVKEQYTCGKNISKTSEKKMEDLIPR